MFEDITEHDIGVVEHFVRDELVDFVESNPDNGKQCMTDYFCEFYARCPRKFRFLPGDVKFIQKIRQHIHDLKKKVLKKAFKHFHRKSKHTKDIEQVGTNDQVAGTNDQGESMDNGLKKNCTVSFWQSWLNLVYPNRRDNYLMNHSLAL